MHAQNDVEVLTCVKSRTDQVKVEFTETCPFAAWCAAILSFQTGIDAILLNYMCLGVCGGCSSPPSGVPV